MPEKPSLIRGSERALKSQPERIKIGRTNVRAVTQGQTQIGGPEIGLWMLKSHKKVNEYIKSHKKVNENMKSHKKVNE